MSENYGGPQRDQRGRPSRRGRHRHRLRQRHQRDAHDAGVRGAERLGSDHRGPGSPKRCPICVGGVEVHVDGRGSAKIRAAVAARRNPEMLIIARTDVVDEGRSDPPRQGLCGGRRRHHPADQRMLQVDRRPARDARRLRRAALAADRWAGSRRDRRPRRSRGRGIATYPLVPLMTAAAALRGEPQSVGETRSTQACRVR